MVLTSTEEWAFEAGLGITRQLQDAGIATFRPAAFEKGSSHADIGGVLKSGFRIILLFADEPGTQVAN